MGLALSDVEFKLCMGRSSGTREKVGLSDLEPFTFEGRFFFFFFFGLAAVKHPAPSFDRPKKYIQAV